MTTRDSKTPFGRRAFLTKGTLTLAAASVCPRALVGNQFKPKLSIGLITDLHYADKPPAGSRHYRESLAKLDAAAAQFQKHQISVLIELGDLIDAAETVEKERTYLKTINQKFSKICSNRHYVLGNHCVDTLKKSEFLKGVGQKESYYSFDQEGFHFIVLDACFRSDGVAYERRNFQWTDTNIPPTELKWLEEDLQANEKPVIVLVHQRLDVSNNHGVNNNREVRALLESSGNVIAVFQGHSHQNDLNTIGGIHYCTLVAMVEGRGLANNGFSILNIDKQGSIQLTGFQKQKSRQFA
ncbi:MAG: alkaline phosphatase [Planctomycetaceae bacterium]|nr:alkaline phosphatase [Planctomycetaceae bacterium]